MGGSASSFLGLGYFGSTAKKSDRANYEIGKTAAAMSISQKINKIKIDSNIKLTLLLQPRLVPLRPRVLLVAGHPSYDLDIPPALLLVQLGPPQRLLLVQPLGAHHLGEVGDPVLVAGQVEEGSGCQRGHIADLAAVRRVVLTGVRLRDDLLHLVQA